MIANRQMAMRRTRASDGSVEEEALRGTCLQHVFILGNSTGLKGRCTRFQRRGRLVEDLGQEQWRIMA